MAKTSSRVRRIVIGLDGSFHATALRVVDVIGAKPAVERGSWESGR
jgi:Arc/MetJ family transcription regulator